MAKLKQFLLEHIEKVVLGIVALYSLILIAENLSRDPNVLETPTGPVTVDRDAVHADVERVQRHLNSPSPKLFAKPEIEPVSRLVDEAWWQWKRPTTSVDLDWYAYLQPPPPLVLPKIVRIWKEPVKDPPIFTRVGAPKDLRVYVGENRILVTCVDSDGIRYPKPGSVKVILWRKIVGYGKEELSPEIRSAFLRAPRATGGGESSVEALPSDNPYLRRMEETPKTTESVAATDNSAWLEARKEEEIRAEDDTHLVCDPSDLVAEGWEIVAAEMTPLSTPLDPDGVMALLKTGKLPTPAPAKKEEATPTTKRSSALFREEAKPKSTETPSDGTASLSSTYEPRMYYFLDEKVAENVLYRYRVVTELRAQDIPPEIRQMKEHRLWALRAEISDMGAPYLAPPESQFKAFLEAEKQKPRRDAHGGPEGGDPRGQLTFIPVAFDEETGQEKNVFDKTQSALTPLGKAYYREPIYSAFTYSDVVLTPVRRRILLINAAIEPSPLVSLRVETITPEGEIKAKSYQLTPPKLPGKITPVDLLAKKPDGRTPLWPPVEHPLHEVYLPLTEGMKLEEIGDISKLGGKEYDFRTGWALIDIRPYRVIRKRYKEVDGEWKLIGEPFNLTQTAPKYYIVVQELKPVEGQSPRVKRIVRKEKQPEEKEGFKTEFEYDFEPELHDKIKERMEKEAAAAKAAESKEESPPQSPPPSSPSPAPEKKEK